MARVVVVVDDLVGLGRIPFGKFGMRVCAVQAFLVSIDHRLPVVLDWVCQGSSDGELGKVDLGNQVS